MPSPPAATALEAAALAEELTRFRVLPQDRLSDLIAEFPGGGPADLADYLVARGALTPFQAGRALAGQTRTLALGPYRLTGPLGPGVLGPLLRAEKGGAAFALRVLPLRSLWQAKQAKQYARTLAALPPHPAVVPLVDADSANGFHFLAWPLTPGEPLAELVRVAGPFLPPEAATLLAHLAAALAACHARQVVHGLLGLRAVVLGRDSVPKLLELGAGVLFAHNLGAKESLFDTLSAAVAVTGVFDAAAPEWLADPTNPTPAADQYGLGAVGHFALTGSLPSRTNPRPLRETNPAVPAALAAVIDRLLQPDPADRFTGMDEAREVLAELAGLPPPDSVPLSAPVPSVSCHTGNRTNGTKAGGSATWAATGSGTQRPPDRDDTEASVRFDLPAPEADPEPVAAAVSLAGVPAPRRPAGKTPPPGVAQTPRPPAPPDAPPAEGESPLLDQFDALDSTGELPALPVLPATPLAGGSKAEAMTSGSRPGLAERAGASPAAPAQPPSGSVLWKRMKRKVLFWQTPTDEVHLSVFGPPAVARSEAPRLTVFVHQPGAAESVGTLARAFQHGAELLGTGAMVNGVERGVRLAVHAAVAHASGTNPLQTFTWRGQPHRLTFDLVVPWEAPVGPAAGVVSVGRDDVRIGKVEFALPILDGNG